MEMLQKTEVVFWVANQKTQTEIKLWAWDLSQSTAICSSCLQMKIQEIKVALEKLPY